MKSPNVLPSRSDQKRSNQGAKRDLTVNSRCYKEDTSNKAYMKEGYRANAPRRHPAADASFHARKPARNLQIRHIFLQNAPIGRGASAVQWEA